MESIKNFDFEKMILRLTGWKNIVERLINSWMQVDVLTLTFLKSQWCNRSNILIWNRIWFLILLIQFHNKMKFIYFLNLKLKSRFWFRDAKIGKKDLRRRSMIVECLSERSELKWSTIKRVMIQIKNRI